MKIDEMEFAVNAEVERLEEELVDARKRRDQARKDVTRITEELAQARKFANAFVKRTRTKKS